MKAQITMICAQSSYSKSAMMSWIMYMFLYACDDVKFRTHICCTSSNLSKRHGNQDPYASHRHPCMCNTNHYTSYFLLRVLSFFLISYLSCLRRPVACNGSSPAMRAMRILAIAESPSALDDLGPACGQREGRRWERKRRSGLADMYYFRSFKYVREVQRYLGDSSYILSPCPTIICDTSP